MKGETAGQAVVGFVVTVERVSLANITQIYQGTNQVQRIVMARQLLKGISS